MKARIAVLAVFVSILGVINLSASPARVINSNAVILVPPAIGEFQRSDTVWNIRRADGSSEEGAVYKLAASGSNVGMPVQLDFFRNVDAKHDGVMCYLLQGELLHHSELISLRTTPKPVRLLLSLTGTKNRLRLVATTECFANYCDEENLQSGWGFHVPEFASLKAALIGRVQNTSGVVPVSVMLTAEVNNDNRHKTEQELRRQMHDFLQAFDFSPAQLQAASQ